MAHDPSHEHHANVDHAAMGIEKEHPTWSTYWKVATILTLITVVEVWIYYIPSYRRVARVRADAADHVGGEVRHRRRCSTCTCATTTGCSACCSPRR